MCNKIETSAAERAIGYFKKGNEPVPIRMEIIVAPCKCKGEDSRFYARTPEGIVWVEAEAEDAPAVDVAAVGRMAAEVAAI